MEVKLADCPELAKFLDDESFATAALPVDHVGTIHAATMGYAHRTDPLTFYFVTGKASEKCTLLKNGEAVRGALVVGTCKDTPFTLQMRGDFRIVEANSHPKAIETFYKKHSSRDDIDDPKNILLEFTPTWARFTDYAKGWEHSFLDL